MELNSRRIQYNIPQIIYVDINADIKTKRYQLWRKETIRMGWKIHEVQDWTRKGSGEHKNTNIDIILTRDIEEKDIKVSLLEYNENISDHKPIRVTINNKRISKPKKKDKEMIIDKKWLKKPPWNAYRTS